MAKLKGENISLWRLRIEARQRRRVLEWAQVHGRLYGTSRNQVSREVFDGRDIILEVITRRGQRARVSTDSLASLFCPIAGDFARTTDLPRNRFGCGA